MVKGADSSCYFDAMEEMAPNHNRLVNVDDLCRNIDSAFIDVNEISVSDVDDAPLSVSELSHIEKNIKEPYKYMFNEYFIQQKGSEIKNCRKLINRFLQI